MIWRNRPDVEETALVTAPRLTTVVQAMAELRNDLQRGRTQCDETAFV